MKEVENYHTLLISYKRELFSEEERVTHLCLSSAAGQGLVTIENANKKAPWCQLSNPIADI